MGLSFRFKLTRTAVLVYIRISAAAMLDVCRARIAYPLDRKLLFEFSQISNASPEISRRPYGPRVSLAAARLNIKNFKFPSFTYHLLLKIRRTRTGGSEDANACASICARCTLPCSSPYTSSTRARNARADAAQSAIYFRVFATTSCSTGTSRL